MNKFSILTGCHNNAPFLEDYANSIINLDYDNLEVIFVVDNSTDDSLEVAQDIILPKMKDRDISFIISNTDSPDLTSKGCGSAYWVYYHLATGDYCGVLDSDDTLRPHSISTMLEAYNRYPDAIYAFSQFELFNPQMKYQEPGYSKPPPVGKSFLNTDFGPKPKCSCFSHFRTYKNFGSQCSNYFQPGLLAAVDKNMGYVLEETGKGVFVDSVLYNYRYKTKNCVTLNTPSVAIWYEVKKAAIKRRADKKIQSFPVYTLKP